MIKFKGYDVCPEYMTFTSRGKVPNELVNLFGNLFIHLIDRHLDDAAKASLKHPVMSPVGYSMLNWMMFDMQYDDTHPAYKGISAENTVKGESLPPRVRNIPYCEFTMDDFYNGNRVDDTHWNTAIKSIRKQVAEYYNK